MRTDLHKKYFVLYNASIYIYNVSIYKCAKSGTTKYMGSIQENANNQIIH